MATAVRWTLGVAGLFAVGLASAAGPAVVAAAASAVTGKAWADVDALVSYETRQVLASGVTRIETWQERLVRRGDQVWTERVLPPSAEHLHAHETAAEHHGHKHLNADTSARWLRLDAKGLPELKLVDRENKVIVAVPAAEFGSVSFDGRYDAAATVVPPAVVKAMKPQGRPDAQGQWYGERNQGWSHRVLWSEASQLALRVESQRDDGTVVRKVSVRLLPVGTGGTGSTVPWLALSGYAPRHYDEFMD
ncbi:hypothetical protein [Sphaerotilus sp.]|uniref:hypothetical protein n=1 Tax=Sphaerotilus sp. TaxID=2093942 RepID=UPI0025DD2FC3|nr:hypothetical protein [Sphaerotilus sp.]